MLHSRQVSLIKRIFAHIDAGTTDQGESVGLNAVSHYFSAAHYQLEKEHLFRRRPTLIGLSGLLPAAGDYRVEDLNGTSILLVRTPSGKINGFLNYCRHRGAQLAQGSGHDASQFVCPYHAWSYDLDGLPRALIPRGQYPNLAPCDRRLTEVQVSEVHGLIWVHPLADAAKPVDLQELGPELASYNLGRFSHFETRRLAKKMNWKLVIDTFLESAHFPCLHARSIAPLFIPGRSVFEPFGEHCMIIYPRTTIHTLRGQPEHTWDLLRHAIIIYVVFPNNLIIWQKDHVELWRSFPDADDASRCYTEASLYSPKPATNPRMRSYWDKNMALLLQTVEDEDFPIAEGAQKGFLSGAQSHLTFGLHEPALTYYHLQLSRALTL